MSSSATTGSSTMVLGSGVRGMELREWNGRVQAAIRPITL
jgi:hypothetical protein